MSAIQSIADSLQGYDAQSLPVPVAVEFLARLLALGVGRTDEHQAAVLRSKGDGR